MDFITAAATNPLLGSVLIIVGFLIIAAYAVVVRVSHLDSGQGLLSALGFVAIATPVFLFGLTNLFPAEEARDKEVSNTISEEYGLTVSPLQLKQDLKYPAERPGAGYKVFGSIETVAPSADGNLKSKGITLIWSGDKFILAEQEGSEYITLEPKR